MIQSILYNLPFLFALFCILSIVFTRRPSQPIIRKALLIYLIDSAVLLFCYAATMHNELDIHLITRPLFVLTLTALFPLYYINIRLTTLDINFKTHYYWILAPSVILAAATFVILFMMSPAEFESALLYEQTKTPKILTDNIRALYLVDIALIVAIIAELVVMIVGSFRAIFRYKVKINNFYTDGAERVKGLKVEIIFITIIAIITVSELVFATREHYDTNNWMLALTAITMLLPQLILTFRSQTRQFTIQEFEQEKSTSDNIFLASQQIVNKKEALNMSDDTPLTPCQESALAQEQLDTVEVNISYIAERIVEAVEVKKLFLKTDLRITDVCDILCTNRTYISQAINTHLGGNFSDFINRYRLEEAKRLLRERGNDNYTIESLAAQAGFSTAASMNRTFRKIEDLTPHQYRQTSMR